jgi:aminodeoxychorismate synthase component I
LYIFGPDEFKKAAEQAGLVPLIYSIDLNGLTPVDIYERLAAGHSGTFLLDSAGGSSELAAFSFVGSDPIDSARITGRDPLPVLRDKLAGHKPAAADVPFPVWGGAFGFLAYDIARYFEAIPETTLDDLDVPEAYFVIPGLLAVLSHVDNRLYICVNQIISGGAEASLDRARKKLENSLTRLDTIPKAIVHKPFLWQSHGKVTATLSRRQYEGVVARTREYIYAGDIFQANLSTRFSFPFDGDPFGLYLSLRKINPSPFAAYLNAGDFALCSSSPERLVGLRDGKAFTRPIAGTRRRGKDAAEDSELSAELIVNEKERAEHVMLVDLERNDLGRVCSYGSVKPDELFAIEKYSHVIHIVSNITGILRPDKDQFDLVRSMFPGGTITGCPKIRCMEIIEELEPTRRGPYTGSIGYFGFNGNCDTNIIIRTLLLADGSAHVQAGAGIVADSDPTREYYESVSKAAALLKAAGMEGEAIKWETLPT